MLTIIMAMCGIYLMSAALLRLPALMYIALARGIAEALYWQDKERAAALSTVADGRGCWTYDRLAQRALDRATRSALRLTDFLTLHPTQSSRAIAFIRELQS